VDEYFNYVKRTTKVTISEVEQDSTTFLAVEGRYQEGDYANAAAGLEGYLNRFPQGLFALKAHYLLADSYFRQGQNAKALPHYEAVADAAKNQYTERSLYNGALAGISLDGDRFFYVNPLASDGDHHRKAWFGCACCPSNICRFMASLGNYIYAANDTALYVNLYIGNEAQFKVGKEKVSVALTTNYPWQGNSTIRFHSNMYKSLLLRVPDWCNNYTVVVNDKPVSPMVANGYAYIKRHWQEGDELTICMDMPVELVAADPRVKANEGRRAVQRGPLVYCAEQTDNATDIEYIILNDTTPLTAVDEPVLLGGIVAIDAPTFRLIPYYAWDNRENGKMAVWLLHNSNEPADD
jgi:DUF1680 family protein